MRLHSLCASLALALATGCGSDLRPPDEPAQVVLAIAMVPADVACIRITATGTGRIIARELDVSPGGALTESFGGLPLGSVGFVGEAFAGACDSVSKSTVPSWISDREAVTLALGRLANVTLTMHRNGRAKVAFDFADEPACVPGARTACPDAGADVAPM